MTNSEILRQMKKIYYPKGKEYLDWMGFKITEENKPSYHHIIKKEDLKKKHENFDATIENGAYLGNLSHSALHFIEGIDKELYYSWNHLFLVINKMKCYPVDDVLKMIEKLQKLSEERVANYNNKKL